MQFNSTRLQGVYLIVPTKQYDARGFFARIWSKERFREEGLVGEFDYSAVSYNEHRGTLRGMHYQVAPAEEVKLIRCSRGAVFDVLLDLRPTSQTYMQWLSVELEEESGKSLYVPPGIAHGFLTLKDHSEVHYQIAGEYEPNCSRGVRWNDSAFNIEWPFSPTVVSERDTSYDSFPIP